MLMPTIENAESGNRSLTTQSEVWHFSQGQIVGRGRAGPRRTEDVDELETVQKKATGMIKGL